MTDIFNSHVMVTKSGSAVTQQLQRPPQHPLQVWVISATWLPSDSPWGPSLRIYQTCPERGKWNMKSAQRSNYSLARAVFKWDEAIAVLAVWYAGPLSWSNWNWRCWFLLRENQRRTLGARWKPTTNSTHIWHWGGIEPGPHWLEVNTITTAPSLFPMI